MHLGGRGVERQGHGDLAVERQAERAGGAGDDDALDLTGARVAQSQAVGDDQDAFLDEARAFEGVGTLQGELSAAYRFHAAKTTTKGASCCIPRPCGPREPPAIKIHGRVYGGPKWTVSPVYEGLLKEELDAAAERHPQVPYQPALIDATYAGGTVFPSGSSKGCNDASPNDPRANPLPKQGER